MLTVYDFLGAYLDMQHNNIALRVMGQNKWIDIRLDAGDGKGSKDFCGIYFVRSMPSAEIGSIEEKKVLLFLSASFR
jgi:hypothetical protein